MKISDTEIKDIELNIMAMVTFIHRQKLTELFTESHMNGIE